ncbi:uncharacterized protein [Phyllobates terribilis]|uniref:uncharacterized protein n=1 Tax=Phyllobates terribilis TaxID=111132 RepID=UPI003CCAC0B7
MGLKDIGETLPPGFRFNPSDEELVCHYLYKKIANEEVLKGTLIEVDLHICEPWQLPEVAKMNTNEWYFFSFRDRKYATGFRTNRATATGYWKATGKDRIILDPKTRQLVGMRKTLVFYQNRAPNGFKTPWIMHEFRMETPHMPPKEDWVLCRVFYKSKGESTTHDNHHIFDNLEGPKTITSFSPPPLVDPYTMETTCRYQRYDSFPLNPSSQSQTQILTQSSNIVDTSLLNPNAHFLQLIKEGNPTAYSMTNSSRNNDGNEQLNEVNHYDLLWDMAMDVDNAGLVHGAHRDYSYEDGNGIVLQ